MIRGIHGLFYSSDPAATRAFMRDALRLPFTDVGEGWLIFDLSEGDIGVHPIDAEGRPPANTHDISFYCDDIQATVADLRSRGVEFKSDPADHGYGWVTYFTMPGGVEVQLYEPKYQKAMAKPPAAPKPAARSAGKPAAGKPAAGKPAAKPVAKPTARKPTPKPAAKPAKRQAKSAPKKKSKR